MMAGRWKPIDAPEVSIHGVRPLRRVVHRDPRWFLIEVLRDDDRSVDGSRFRMTYSSLKVPGDFRDKDRWHAHRVQTDRFVTVLGEMMLALLDDRSNSPTRGRLEVLRLTGSPFVWVSATVSAPAETYLVPIPPGVLHCIGNLSDAPFFLQNCPTELYDPSDEGRIPFTERPVGPADVPFSWSEVERRRGPEAA